MAVVKRVYELYATLRFEEDLAGHFAPQQEISEKERAALPENIYLADGQDQVAHPSKAGIYEDWAQARGVFRDKQDTVSHWWNDDDHLRVISVRSDPPSQ